MALDQEKIRRAFRARLYTVPQDKLSRDRIAYDNVAFTPPPQEPPMAWVREQSVVGSERLAATNMLELVGTMIYDVMWPLGEGTEVPADLARRIADAMKPTTVVSRAGDPQIEVQSAAPLQGREDEAYEQSWWRVPVWVAYRAYGANS